MVLGLVTVLVTFMFYYILKLLNTNELMISTISLTASLVASYLMLRRSSNYAIAFVINDVILITLWGIACPDQIRRTVLLQVLQKDTKAFREASYRS